MLIFEIKKFDIFLPANFDNITTNSISMYIKYIRHKDDSAQKASLAFRGTLRGHNIP